MSELKAAASLIRGDALFLNQHQQPFGWQLGDYRLAASDALGRKPRVVQDRGTRRGNDRGGGLAELAVAVRLNLCPVLEFEKTTPYNLRLASGEHVNVVWDRYGVIKLDCGREAEHRALKKEPPDLYLVLMGDGNPTPHGWLVFTFAGWATHEEVVASPIDDVGRGPFYRCTTLHPTLEILTPLRGAGYREGPTPGRFDFEVAEGA